MTSKQIIAEEIQNITAQLIRSYEPEKIILFGSAVNAAGAANDLDFLIVKRDVPSKGIDRIRQVRSMIKKNIAADFLVLTPGELQTRTSLGDPFVSHILHTGKILYGRS